MLVTTLTKRMAEDLTEYLDEHGVRVRYLHSDIETVERMEIIRDLRLGKFDAIVGINLLREGLDMPEVSLVAILDADKEGFLRSEGSLIQTIGRAARHLQRSGDPLCGPDHRLDAARDGGNRAPARQAAGIQCQHMASRHAASARPIRDVMEGARSEAEPSPGRRGKAGAEPGMLGPGATPEQIDREVKRLEARDAAARAQPGIRGGGGLSATRFTTCGQLELRTSPDVQGLRVRMALRYRSRPLRWSTVVA